MQRLLCLVLCDLPAGTLLLLRGHLALLLPLTQLLPLPLLPLLRRRRQLEPL